MKLLKAYPEEKINALAAFLGEDPGRLQVWSDDSVTIQGNYKTEYYASRRMLQHRQHIGKQSGFNIFKSY